MDYYPCRDGSGDGATVDATDQVNETAISKAPRLPWGELAALALYGAVLFFYRPLDPFEWDEVLFQRALDRYDVASHSPHPPGYPLYVAMARTVRLAVSDPQLALQLVGIASALAALALTWVLARRLGAPRGAATAAAAALAVVPGFLFNANIGMSDVPGVAAGVGVAFLFALAWERPWLLAVASFAGGALTGVRIASLLVAVPFAVVALAVGWHRRAWRWLALSPVAAIVAAAAVWVPAVLVTGSGRFANALRVQSGYIETTWVKLRLPGAGLDTVLHAWGARWLGTGVLAVLLWVLVLAGAAAWWRRGERRLVALCAVAAFSFLGFCAFELEYGVSMRYALPAAPFLTILAAGTSVIERKRLRLLASAALLAWLSATAFWVAPALPVRRRPAPVWQAMKWVRATMDPASTEVIVDRAMNPHAVYLLGRSGFHFTTFKWQELQETVASAGAATVIVAPRPIAGTEVLFALDWDSPLVMRLARNRYGSCVVSRKLQVRPVLELSPEISPAPTLWRLNGTGSLRLSAGTRPAVVVLTARDRELTVSRPGLPAATVGPGETLRSLIMPGPAGAITVGAASGGAAEIGPIELLDLDPKLTLAGLAPAYVVPQVAHADGAYGSRWRTDLLLFNPNSVAIEVAATFLPTGRANVTAVSTHLTLAAGRTSDLRDVAALRAFAGVSRAGALLLRATTTPARTAPAFFVASSRTYNLKSTTPQGTPAECVPSVPLDDGLCGGARARYSGVRSDAKRRVNLAVVALSTGPVTVRVWQRRSPGAALTATTVELPPFGFLQKRLEGEIDGGTVELEISAGSPDARVYSCLSQIEQDSGLPQHSVPAIAAPGCAPSLPPPPFPRELPPAPTPNPLR
jgi:4-amino-4-deoxy-L-arabinose transferase-like glycosyltransferase